MGRYSQGPRCLLPTGVTSLPTSPVPPSSIVAAWSLATSSFQSRYSPLLGDGARLLCGGSGRGRRCGSRRCSPRFALIGTQSLLRPAQQMARENPQPPRGAVPVWIPVPVCVTVGARAHPAGCSHRLRHGFRLVPPPGTAGRGERSLRAAPGATIRCSASQQPLRRLGGGCRAPGAS